MENSIELKRQGRSYEVNADQVTSSNIALIYGLDPKTIWLKDAISGTCYFPSSEGQFANFQEHVYSLVVEGSPPATERCSNMHGPVSLSACGSTPPVPSTSAPFGGNKYNSCTTKIIKAEKYINAGGKVEFKSLEVTYIDLKPSTATVSYVQSIVQKKWGDQFVIVSNDGLKICDSSATRGIKFWRVGSRKLFAVVENKGKKRQRISESDDDDNLKYSRIEEKLETIDLKISAILEVTPRFSLPLGLSTLLLDAFRCQICHSSPIIPPAVFSGCCKRVLGCQTCVDRWYEGDEGRTKSCPLCRAERGYEGTSAILGLDEFLARVNDIVHVPRPPAMPSNLPETGSPLLPTD